MKNVIIFLALINAVVFVLWIYGVISTEVKMNKKSKESKYKNLGNYDE